YPDAQPDSFPFHRKSGKDAPRWPPNDVSPPCIRSPPPAASSLPGDNGGGGRPKDPSTCQRTSGSPPISSHIRIHPHPFRYGGEGISHSGDWAKTGRRKPDPRRWEPRT